METKVREFSARDTEILRAYAARASTVDPNSTKPLDYSTMLIPSLSTTKLLAFKCDHTQPGPLLSKRHSSPQVPVRQPKDKKPTLAGQGCNRTQLKLAEVQVSAMSMLLLYLK
jgi:hypothetical protein